LIRSIVDCQYTADTVRVGTVKQESSELCYRKDDHAMNPNLGEEEVVGGRGWYHSKERW